MHNAQEYTHQLGQLMPRGVLWDDLTQSDSEFMNWMGTLAQEFARIDARVSDLIDETDPRSMFEMLYDWEQYLGLPDKCIGQAETLEQRREAVLELLTSVGGQSRQYFIDLALKIGFVITIIEFDPFTVAGSVNELIYGQNWQFAWQVNAPAETVTELTISSDVNTALASWGNTRLECVLTRLKPAHTIILFSYGG
ncbi:MAG: putative phage tail protein [Cycloclasticus sp.]